MDDPPPRQPTTLNNAGYAASHPLTVTKRRTEQGERGVAQASTHDDGIALRQKPMKKLTPSEEKRQRKK